jgi:hypothetical protein
VLRVACLCCALCVGDLLHDMVEREGEGEGEGGRGIYFKIINFFLRKYIYSKIKTYFKI